MHQVQVLVSILMDFMMCTRSSNREDCEEDVTVEDGEIGKQGCWDSPTLFRKTSTATPPVNFRGALWSTIPHINIGFYL
jgi:hypothetical protein